MAKVCVVAARLFPVFLPALVDEGYNFRTVYAFDRFEARGAALSMRRVLWLAVLDLYVLDKEQTQSKLYQQCRTTKPPPHLHPSLYLGTVRKSCARVLC